MVPAEPCPTSGGKSHKKSLSELKAPGVPGSDCHRNKRWPEGPGFSGLALGFSSKVLGLGHKGIYDMYKTCIHRGNIYCSPLRPINLQTS